ncbi:MAG: sensor hybrid histidine kinase [Phycisphaerales bacterium]|nr:sensor hybrid histidine kinase [Phycisphaerales bacterium]
MRHLATLLALPPVWAGYDELRIADSLAEALVRALDLDFVYLCLHAPTDTREVQLARNVLGPLPVDRTDEVGRALAQFLNQSCDGARRSIPHPNGAGAANIVCVTIGWESGEGMLVAGSRHETFPAEDDELLIRVGANQAALAIQRQRAERASHLAHDRLVHGVRGSNIGLWEMDLPAGGFRLSQLDFTNIVEMLGYDRSELASDFASRISLVHPDDRARVEGAIQDYLSGKTGRLEVEHRARHKHGSYRWMLSRGSAIRDAAGRPSRLVGSSVDITEHKQTEEKLRRSKALLAEAQQVGHTGSWNWELASDAVEWSDEHYRIFGLPPQAMAITYDRFLSLVHPQDRASVDRRVEQALRERRPYECTLRAILPEGAERIIFSQGRVEFDEAGKPIRMFGTVQDITERKRLEVELRRAKEAAETASRTKDLFLATVSHELRTPLAGILLWSQMLESRTLGPDDEAKALRAIRESARAQQQLIDDLLDISRILAGEMRLDAQEVELASVAQAAVDIVRPIAAAKGIKIEETLVPAASRVLADRSRVQQIVLNLLNNAVKFTPAQGRICVNLRNVGQTLEIQVADTGQGISAEFLPHVFERFRQADGGNARRHGGLGLGLAIARELVELHGGQIRADSPGKGQGATFTLELPVSNVRPEAPAADRVEPSTEAAWRFEPSSVLRGIRALVIEDDVTNREVIQYMLEKCEAEVTAIENAADGLRVFSASLRGTRFDLLLSDIGLPEMNGHDLIRQVRLLEQQNGQSRPTPAVALTAYARDQDRAAALAAGFNAHLTKPIMAAVLVKTVAQCIGRSVT